ncbi:carbohydrate-binding family 9-like protein [Paenibacillus kandeliae]|uniref:carbohydrate-binding family 9-like protein n=1 Tax=Paenibacillus kandeliae TaxID=3231269 RepID=UPI00345A45EA
MNPLSAVPEPKLAFQPKHYVCRRAVGQSDWSGRLDQPFWQHAEWTDVFVDIEGHLRPHPTKQTRVKMLWDDDYFYIAAEMLEDEIWAYQTERDSVIFYDNDFEIFIDPDGDTHQYYEFEINALGTVWDLLLVKPYRDDGPPINGWDISGLKTAVHIDGQLNNPAADNRMWSVEIAMPWRILQECAPGKRPPLSGEHWRVNFSRVEWQVDVVDGQYIKRSDPVTGKSLPEDNWVWSPQGVVNMHYPEMWGYVIFDDQALTGTVMSDTTMETIQGSDTQAETDALYNKSFASQIASSPAQTELEQLKWTLRRLYYKQRLYAEQYGVYSNEIEPLLNIGDTSFPLAVPSQLSIQTTSSMFQLSAPLHDQTLVCIRQDGLIWQENRKQHPASNSGGGIQ